MNIKDKILALIWAEVKAVDIQDDIIYLLDHDGAVYDMTCPEQYKEAVEVDQDMFIANSKIGR